MNWIPQHPFWSITIAMVLTAIVVVLVMNFTRSDKSLSRRLLHRFDIADPQFRREMSVMLGPPVADGNHVAVLQNGAEIFPAMLDAIRAAEQSITFETYIYWSGTIGSELTAALSEKARAGIAVHITIDWAGSVKLEQALLDDLITAGAEVERYRPLHWYRLGRLNNRTHRKLLVVDGRVAFTGGVGIADHWRGNAEDPDHWRDLHFRVEGPATAQFQAAFNDNWMKMTGRVLSGAVYFPELGDAGEMAAQLFIASPAGGAESMHLMYLMIIAAATSTIDLAAAYFVPDPMLIGALIDARHRGVRIRILLPGPHIDSETVRIAAKSTWGPLLREGVEIHLYQPTMMHAKMIVIDALFVSVGSTNFDYRSFRLNDEASLNVFDRNLARELTEVFEGDLRRATTFTYAMWKNRPVRQRIAEALIQPIKRQL